MTQGTSNHDASVSAAINNNKHQKDLELKLDDLDKEWYSRLKTLARERLDVLLELYKYIKTQHTAGHLKQNAHGERLKLYFDKELERRKEDERKKSNKFNFQVDEFAKIPLHFPDLDDMFNDRKCYSSCALSSISEFTNSWNLASMSSETSSEHKQGLIEMLNRSLRDNVPYRPTIVPRKRKFKRKRRQLSLVDVPTVPVLPDISVPTRRSLPSTPQKSSQTQIGKTPSPFKQPTGSPTYLKTYSPQVREQPEEFPEGQNTQPKTDKRARQTNSRWMLPGIV